jgi:hypothetical protein
MIDWLFTGGRIADILLVTLALETLALAAYRRATGRGPAFVDIAGTLLSGFCLAFAIRLALTGGPPLALAACLTGSFLGHLHDLWRRGGW